MASFNKVILMGNLTRDPQLKYLPSQTAVAEFGIAVNRKFKSGNGEEREEVTFVDVTSFGKQAEVFGQYFTKGSRSSSRGGSNTTVGGPAGRREATQACRSSSRTFQFVGGRSDGGGGEDAGGPDDQRQQSRTPQRPQRQQAEQPFGDEGQFKEDDIPF
jgi:single-strand DNA-binding protein